jgi:hypothetical protein
MANIDRSVSLFVLSRIYLLLTDMPFVPPPRQSYLLPGMLNLRTEITDFSREQLRPAFVSQPVRYLKSYRSQSVKN